MEMPGTEVPSFGTAERAPPPNPGFHLPEVPPKHSLEALELADLHHPNCKINRKVMFVPKSIHFHFVSLSTTAQGSAIFSPKLSKIFFVYPTTTGSRTGEGTTRE